MEFDNELNEKISFDEFMKNEGARFSESMENILQHLNESAEEIVVSRHKEMRPIRTSTIGVLQERMAEEIMNYTMDDDYSHLNALKLILEVTQLLRKENEWNGE